MIPMHRPAFGIATVLASSLADRKNSSLNLLEEVYAEVSGCAEAVWLPLARAGICWALRAAIGEQTKVVAPAFTCESVHEAIAEGFT